MQKCKKCSAEIPALCRKCNQWLGDPTSVLNMVGRLEANHGSVPGATIHELLLMGDIPPKKKGKTQSANTVLILQKYAQVLHDIREL